MIVRVFLAGACAVSGFFIANSYYGFPWSLIGLGSGLVVAFLVIKLEQSMRKIPLRVIFGGVVGVFVGLFLAFLVTNGLRFVSNIMERQQVVPWIYFLLVGILGYLGLVIGSKKIDEFQHISFGQAHENRDDRILDTSVIIDGRIADICDTGFLEGNLIVPRFVLDELQYIADSSDSMKRSRGRRGLDILNRMQKIGWINIEISDQEFPKIKGVDAKLIALAKRIRGKIVTNDFNLNKVAEIQGIKILNVNELANALKPVVLPGEVMSVKIVKEGKEAGQGVAYLDDGTMIIVDNAQRFIASTVDVVVTSVLQTTAGRMIFSELRDAAGERKTFGAAGR